MDTTHATGMIGTGIGVFILIMVVIGLLSALLIGALARWVLPGPDPMSWLTTIGYGLGGSFLGGIVGRLLHFPNQFSFLLSVACAALLIWFFRRRKKPAA